MESASPNQNLVQQLPGTDYKFYSLAALKDDRIKSLPYSIRILLEASIRNYDGLEVANKILDFQKTQSQDIEIPFKPSRVILQDFTGVPLIVDLAAMRDGVKRLNPNGDVKVVQPQCQVDLVIDHSVMVDSAGKTDSLEYNTQKEFERNQERFQFLKWGQKAFQNLKIVPPGSGIVHQVNLEYLAKSVMIKDNILYPDSVVGTDSHTTMINGLGVLGWGVGGIEAEAVMLGESTSMVLPEVVGFKFTGQLPVTSTATDLVLTCTEMLRKRKVVGKFVEYFGPGVQSLSLADRSTVANMAPEYGATTGFFPVDQVTIDYLKMTGRDSKWVDTLQAYLKENMLFRTYDGQDPIYSGEVLELDLSTVVPSLAGPKRPMDRVRLSDLASSFNDGLCKPVTFSSFGIDEARRNQTKDVQLNGQNVTLKHGSIVIAAITSCTNTSNPGVMLAAGMLAKNAVEKGLTIPSFVKTSLSPGSKVVTQYYEKSGLSEYLNQLGFNTTGYGCMTCIGNSGDIDPTLQKTIMDEDIVVASVLSGNRNFEGRVHPATKANYLCSPPLVVALAIAGNVTFNFETTPLGNDKNGNPVFLKDIWPSRTEVQELENKVINPEMYKEVYKDISTGNKNWEELKVDLSETYSWQENSTYIHNPPFFQTCESSLPEIKNIKDAYCLALFGDSITTDHISPAGNITAQSPAGKYLISKGVQPKDFNSYGTRRGNDEVMARGTFANTRLINKMASKTGPITVHLPSNEEMAIFDAAEKYKQANQQLILIGGKEYGSGSSRDWAAKGPYLQGISVVIAESYERIHRSNLIGMGILPLEFKEGQNAQTLNLTGKERYSLDLKGGNLTVGQDIDVTLDDGRTITTKCRLDTEVELKYFQNGGILLFVLRKLMKA